MKKYIVPKFSALITLGVTLASIVAPGIVNAETYGYHPHYLHARSDLRKAEQLLRAGDEPNVVAELSIAAQDVARGIREIDRAIILDRKDIDDNPPIDTSLRHLSKFREIYKLLRSAERDIAREEDNGATIGLRNHAEVNIDRAKYHVELAASRDVIDDLRSNRY